MTIAGLINKKLKLVKVSYVCKSCGNIIKDEMTYGEESPEYIFGGICDKCMEAGK
jgi:hypothetical protein